MFRTTVEDEVLTALACSRANYDFLIKGGAGSGKTYSMLSFLTEVYKQDPRASVACITYTNVAVNEIQSRFPTPRLHVSTIHDFLWNLIRPFQKNLKSALAKLINDREIKSSLDTQAAASYWKGPLKYREWLDLEAGEISHAEVLKLAKLMFRRYPKLSRILSDRYDYLLVDEYQDTPAETLRLLLEELPPSQDRNLCLGFFGDSEQAIHEEGRGKAIIESAVTSGRLHEIPKRNNRRNPKAVIQVINQLRTDDLEQVQAEDPGAQNYKKEGSATFIYTQEYELSSDKLQELSFCRDWDFDPSSTKLLFLGKALIAREKQFHRLMEIYTKDRVVDYAKKIRNELNKKGLKPPTGASFQEIVSANEATIRPTATQQRAFHADPTHVTFAHGFLFEDIASTSTNSDLLLGTKKVSSFDERNRGEKRDPLINHLFAIQEIRNLHQQGKFSQIIRSIDSAIASIEMRKKVASDLQQLSQMDKAPISEVISFTETSGLLKQKDAVREFAQRQPYRYARVMEVSFKEIAHLYEYVEDHSPYSTHHGVKGSEWDNIFVSLDNGGWNNFNFEKLMADPGSDGSVESRSRMMLYVTCSRAKENLLVYIHQPNQTTLSRAREWFGSQHVVRVD